VRAAAFAAALTVVQSVVLTGASAAIHLHASATGAATATTATWGVSLTPSTSTSLTFGLAVVGDPPPQYFMITNNGTRSLVSATYTVVLTPHGISLLGTARLTLRACAVAWVSNSCSTTAVVINAFSAGSSPFPSTVVPPNAGNNLYIQASVTNAGVSLGASLTVVTTIGISSLSPRDIVTVPAQNH
jgi:hypothetical protein